MARLIRLCATLALYALTAAPAAAAALRVDNSFHPIDVTFQDNASVHVLLRRHKLGDRLALCGVYWSEGFPGAYARNIEREFLTRLRFTIGDRPFKVDTVRFTRASSAARAKAGEAQCVPTGVVWSPAVERSRIGIALDNDRIFSY